MPNKKTFIIIVVVVVVVAGATIVAAVIGGGAMSSSSQNSDENAASSTVATFGQTLQQVSLMAPNASQMIASVYAPYVMPALLQQWEANPTSAPGRVVSSPWPASIQITSVAPQGSGYTVNGQIVFMTSIGINSETPVTIQVINENGTWQIAAFQGQNSTQ